ncbi:DEAD/DEAH box helicase [Nocardioides zeae]
MDGRGTPGEHEQGHGPSPAASLARLTLPHGRAERLRHVRVLPRRAAVTAEWPDWVHPAVQEGYAAQGVAAPWAHQRAAADLAHDGRHVVLATGTASGKSMGYLLPALTTLLDARTSRGTRGASTLYVAPTKALASDQLAAVERLATGIRAVTHDGDSPPELRDWTRDHAEYVLTNPDMLHHSLLPGHQRWPAFWRGLRYVVVDECHHYRGVFGAHVAQVLRRVRRVAAHHGSDPTFVLASATAAEPADTAHRLTGLQVEPITEDASPRGSVTLGMWQPPLTSHQGENGAPLRRAAGSEAADLLADLVVDGVRTLAFVRSRKGSEQVARTAREHLADVDPALPGRVTSYRGGYLPEERREIERALRSGELLGLAATNALELGIDVAGLDAVLVVGFPGTRAALWQQVGRAGRARQDSLGLLVARDDPLDTFLVAHPEALLDAPVEQTVFDPDNPYVLAPHLCAAAADHPSPTPTSPSSAPPPRCSSTSSSRRGCCAADRRATSGRTAAGRATSPTSGRAAAPPCSSSRPAAAASSARSTPRGRTARPTRAPSTCTSARPGSSRASTSTSTWRCCGEPTRRGQPRPARSPTSASSRSSAASTGAGAVSPSGRST